MVFPDKLDVHTPTIWYLADEVDSKLHTAMDKSLAIRRDISIDVSMDASIHTSIDISMDIFIDRSMDGSLDTYMNISMDISVDNSQRATPHYLIFQGDYETDGS